MTSFQRSITDHGLPVYLQQTTQFKTITLQLFIDRAFADDYSWFALLPHVLKRGCAAYPDSLTLERHFDELYGASFGATAHRLGERHVIELQLELADESLLSTKEPLLAAGLETLGEMLLRPLTRDGVFLPEYVAQEQEAQIRAIRSIYNDKAEYAHLRCLQEMFGADPFARQAIGDAEQVAQITPGNLWQFYQRVLQESNFQLFVSGNVTAEQIVSLCNQTFDRRLGTERLSVAPPQLPPVRAPREVVEEQPVAQGKLVLAYRTGVNRRDPLFLASLIYNGLLGGFGHSKLFQNVRERASLAYDCSSGVIATKGVLLVEAGISPDDLLQARSIIDQQIEAMRQGDWTEEEWDKTVLGLQNSMRGLVDRPSRLSLTHFDRLVNGVVCSDEELIAGLRQVTREQVLSIAAELQLDTAYFLQGTADDDEENSECN